MNDAVKMFVILTGVTVVCGALLTGVRELTDDSIVKQQIRYMQGPAIRKVLFDASNDPVADKKEEQIADTVVTLFQKQVEGVTTAVALETESMGYGGTMSVITGFDIQSGECVGVAVATASETPGIGTKAYEPSFTQRFAGLPLDKEAKLTKEGGSIDGVSGATISSTAVCAAVAHAQQMYLKIHTQKIMER